MQTNNSSSLQSFFYCQHMEQTPYADSIWWWRLAAVKAVETHCGTCCCASNGDGCGGQEGNTAECGCGMLLVVCTCVLERVCVCVACCSKPRVESVTLGTPELEYELDQTFSTATWQSHLAVQMNKSQGAPRLTWRGTARPPRRRRTWDPWWARSRCPGRRWSPPARWPRTAFPASPSAGTPEM